MKRLVSILLVLTVLLTLISNLSVIVSAESLYIKKIVSVVYDDSGSMNGDKFAYANYAMQAFCGMLNSEDQLFVTYMSDPTVSSEIDLSADGIQNSIDSINSRNCGGSTPYTAVETAYDKLSSVSDSNQNTQYWLVVITDGAFDETNTMSDDNKKSYLNEKIEEYTESVMPNGTNPQIIFLGIGDVILPDENQSDGVYTYSVQSAEEIIDAMSQMADKISGRTRLGSGDIELIGGNKIQVSSSIPLLNIVCFVQGSDAKVTDVVYINETDIPITREADLNYPNYSELVGSAYLIGDSQTVIGSGTYVITFDRDVVLDDIIVLFEPALEMKMTITLNGEEISNFNDLDSAMESDTISVSCKIYEMGTDTEVYPALLPPGTEFEIVITEDGQVVAESTGENMLLSDYTLSNLETEITASVIIEGFNPIEYSVEFTPTQYVEPVPPAVYTMVASFGSDVSSVKFDDIADNENLTVCFTVYADGEAITDADAVRALNPVISVSPNGNDGIITYSDDGKIVFTPSSATISSGSSGSFDVEVTCAIDDGTSASETYTVLISEYEVIPVDTDETITKTEFYGNQVGVAFYITKDGVQLDKEAVENKFSVSLNEEYGSLDTDVSVSDDGVVTVVPFSDEEHKLTFWNWWTNWAYYFRLPGKGVTVTMTHSYGTASSIINVVEEDILYLLLCVLLPLIIELAALATLIAWLICVITKPRYAKNVTLYVGKIDYGNDSHIIRNFKPVNLRQFNRILKKGNGRLKFKRKADIVSAKGIRIRADKGGCIICEMKFPWFRSKIVPLDILDNVTTPDDLVEKTKNGRSLEITMFEQTVAVNKDYDRSLCPLDPKNPTYTVIQEKEMTVNGNNVIQSGKIFVYVKTNYKKLIGGN